MFEFVEDVEELEGAGDREESEPLSRESWSSSSSDDDSEPKVS